MPGSVQVNNNFNKYDKDLILMKILQGWEDILYYISILPVQLGNNNYYKKCVCVCVLSCVQLFTAPWTIAHQAPLPMEAIQNKMG